ncbi:hypothetical protein O3G_MSEX002960 [Manduca sexta]|uniref:Uncharacterized protein n=1 Tax=Manduca sexta TaxID=7130 RepID=A0A922CEX5_MANSE|nr:hypothetical protein O3G_MSEX002960 [Manduca sexta]
MCAEPNRRKWILNEPLLSTYSSPEHICHLENHGKTCRQLAPWPVAVTYSTKLGHPAPRPESAPPGPYYTITHKKHLYYQTTLRNTSHNYFFSHCIVLTADFLTIRICRKL